jgi:hypothetical protein
VLTESESNPEIDLRDMATTKIDELLRQIQAKATAGLSVKEDVSAAVLLSRVFLTDGGSQRDQDEALRILQRAKLEAKN